MCHKNKINSLTWKSRVNKVCIFPQTAPRRIKISLGFAAVFRSKASSAAASSFVIPHWCVTIGIFIGYIFSGGEDSGKDTVPRVQAGGDFWKTALHDFLKSRSRFPLAGGKLPGRPVVMGQRWWNWQWLRGWGYLAGSFLSDSCSLHTENKDLSTDWLWFNATSQSYAQRWRCGFMGDKLLTEVYQALATNGSWFPRVTYTRRTPYWSEIEDAALLEVLHMPLINKLPKCCLTKKKKRSRRKFGIW